MSASTNHSSPNRMRFEPTALPTANTPSAAAIAAFVSGGSMLQHLTRQLVTDNAKEFVSLINLPRSKEKTLSKFKDGFIPSSVKTNTALKGTPNVTKSTHFKDIEHAMKSRMCIVSEWQHAWKSALNWKCRTVNFSWWHSLQSLPTRSSKPTTCFRKGPKTPTK